MKKLFLILLSTGIALSFIAVICLDDWKSACFNFLMSLGTNILGLIITVFFVQKYIDDKKEKIRATEEKDKILRYDRIMSQYISLYLKAFASIVIPNKIGVRVEIKRDKDDEFSFSDLSGMYEPSYMIVEKGVKSSIEIYYEYEEKLAEYIMKVIENIDFEFYPQIQEILMEFYRVWTECDERDMVLWPLRIDNEEGGKNMKKIVIDMIKDERMNWVERNDRGELNGNIMKAYVELYQKVRNERKLIARYEQEIKKLK